jgi:hypothetical protein
VDDFGSRLKLFIRENTPQIAVMIFLALLNILTTSFPWALFPIGAIMISVLISASNIFLSDNPRTMTEREAERLERRAARRAAKYGEPMESRPQTARASKETQSRLNQARAYKREIDKLVDTTNDPLRKDKLRQLSSDVDTWMTTVEEMSQRIDSFKSNQVIQHDLATVPESIKKLTTQLNEETDPRVKESIERTLAARADQMASLQKLQSLMRQAEVQLENSIAALGTIYSQALATQSTSRVADYSHLSTELEEQSKMLRDQLEAMEEVKLDREKANLV